MSSSSSTLPSSACRATKSTRSRSVPRPDLRILPLKEIRLLEDYQPSREDGLADRISSDGFLRHPLVVADVGGTTVVLDGHHRWEFLRRSGCSHALVQQVTLNDPESVSLDTWIHRATLERVEDLLDEIRSQELTTYTTSPVAAEADLAAGNAVCWFMLYGGPAGRVHCLSTESCPCERTLQVVTSVYEPTRLTVADLGPAGLLDPGAAFRKYGESNLLVRFARLGACALAELTRTDRRIPAGVTRLLVPGGRVLGVNLPLEMLRPGMPDTQRRAWLSNRMAEPLRYVAGPSLLAEPEPRRYDEPLLVYDPDLRPRLC